MNTRLVFSFCLLINSDLFAGPRSSASYSVTTEVADNGGLRSTSATYTNDGSAGGIAGVSAVAAPAETAKSGYIAQLYEVTGVSVAASPAAVNEATSRQLAATATLDDTTTTALAGTDVAWSIVSGPISFISPAGLATAGNVYTNTAASVQGTFRSESGTFGLTVVNVGTDDLASYAGDGIDDAWQVQYFGQPPNANAGPQIDPDGDGQTNLFEFTAGLVPTDPASRFVLQIAPVPDPGNPGQFLSGQKNLIFNPLVLTGGRTYTVKFRTDLATGTWTTLTGTTQSDNGSERTVTDLNATDALKFYQVEITKP